MTDGWEEVEGPEGAGHVTDIGERLLKLCAANRLEVGGSLALLAQEHARVDLTHTARMRGARRPLRGGVLAAAPQRCADVWKFIHRNVHHDHRRADTGCFASMD